MIDTKSFGHIGAQFSNSGEVLISFCQYPASGSTVITKEEARKFADEIYELLDAPSGEVELRQVA